MTRTSIRPGPAPRRSAALRLALPALVLLAIGLPPPGGAGSSPGQEVPRDARPARAVPRTRVSIVDGAWRINGEPTYRGTRAEGLLMNVRMVNAVFEDRGRPDFDAEANTDAFIARIPDYKAHGVLAFTLGLQGGFPGYEGAVNSAFRPDGSLRPDYLRRVRRVIEACDREGMVVILGAYYQRQSKVLGGPDAIRAGVENVAGWVDSSGFGNVLLEIANEYRHPGFAHESLRNPEGQAELIRLARRKAPGLLVSTSGMGNGTLDDAVAEASDFLLVHFNHVRPDGIPARVGALRKYGKPIVCNEATDVGEEGARAASTCVDQGVSWGLMLDTVNQHMPFRFRGAADDPVVYARLQELTGGGRSRSDSPAGGEDRVLGGPAPSYFPPPDSQGGWRSATTAEEVRRVAAMDRARLDEAFEIAAASTKNGGLLVVRNGWLVYERYFGRGHREATPNLASCGKSFTSIAVGILMAERPDLFPNGLDQAIFTPAYLPAEAFPLSDPAKADIKLGQLLAFSAGIRGNNPSLVDGVETTLNPPGPDGWQASVDAVALGREDKVDKGRRVSAATLWCRPGEGYSYATASAHIASIMVRHVSGMELQEYVRTRLAEPLGWGRWGYAYRHALEVTHTPGGGGIAARATDMARFGYLLLRGGRWNDRQLVPEDYVRHCGRKSPYNRHSPYSLQFDVNTDGQVAEYPRDAFWKSGSGGHMLYVVPSLDLVVWKLAGRDDQYAPKNTGLPPAPEDASGGRSRVDWKPAIGEREGQRKVLARVIEAISGPLPPGR